jgi:hypothetical protein
MEVGAVSSVVWELVRNNFRIPALSQRGRRQDEV